MNIGERRFSRHCVAALVAAALLVSGAFGATIIVPDNYSTIQEALDASNPIDTILVRPGIYNENLVFPSWDIVLISEMGAMKTIIDGMSSGRVVTFTNGTGVGSVLSGFTLTNGTSTYGGGLYLDDAILTLENNLIVGNTASLYGGGVRCEDFATLILVNNTIVNNQAEFGGGFYGGEDSISTIVNSIFWNNSAPQNQGHEIYVGLGTVDVSYCDVEGGQAEVSDTSGGTLVWGSGNIDANPEFIAAAIGDFHIELDSPCRDAGNIGAVHVPVLDFEGDPRIADDFVDMGADEYHIHLYCRGDIIPSTPIDIMVVGLPVKPISLLLSDQYLDPPMPTLFGDLYLAPPFLYEGFIGKTHSIDGWRKLTVTVPAQWQLGDTYYIQARVGAWYDLEAALTNPVILSVK